MVADFLALLDTPGLLFLVLMAGAAIGIAVERLIEAQRKAERQAYWRGRKRGGGKGSDPAQSRDKSGFDAADQLRVVMEAEFTWRPLLNRPERRLLTHLDKILAEEAPEWRAMCQVSLGEILASKQGEAFRAVNSKRVDFLIVDADSQPLGVIEYQGSGHHQGTAAARDAVKKEALRRASIDYYEIAAGDTPPQLRAIVQRLAMRRSVSTASSQRGAGR